MVVEDKKPGTRQETLDQVRTILKFGLPRDFTFRVVTHSGSREAVYNQISLTVFQLLHVAWIPALYLGIELSFYCKTLTTSIFYFYINNHSITKR